MAASTVPPPALAAPALTRSLTPPKPRPKPLATRPRLRLASRWKRRGGGGGANARLRGLVRRGDLDAAVRLVASMPDPPAVIACGILMKKLCADRRIGEAERVLDALRAAGAANVVAYSTLVNGYCRAGRMDAARRVIASMPFAPNAFTYNPLSGSTASAAGWATRSPCSTICSTGAAPPTWICYAILLEATCKKSGYGQAMDLLDEMRAKGCSPNIVTYNVLINAMCNQGHVDEAVELLNTLPSYGCKPNNISYSTVLKGLCSTKRWDGAERIVAHMAQNDFPQMNSPTASFWKGSVSGAERLQEGNGAS